MPTLRVIGDIHGMPESLDHALEASDRPFILLGDLVDRGPDSAGVLRR